MNKGEVGLTTMNNISQNTTSNTKHKRPYKKPLFEKLGKMTVVTRKSGPVPDNAGNPTQT
jgi:hypothetical protein